MYKRGWYATTAVLPALLVALAAGCGGGGTPTDPSGGPDPADKREAVISFANPVAQQGEVSAKGFSETSDNGVQLESVEPTSTDGDPMTWNPVARTLSGGVRVWNRSTGGPMWHTEARLVSVTPDGAWPNFTFTVRVTWYVSEQYGYTATGGTDGSADLHGYTSDDEYWNYEGVHTDGSSVSSRAIMAPSYPIGKGEASDWVTWTFTAPQQVQKVAWCSSRDGNTEIYVADTVGTEQDVIRVTSSAAEDDGACLSADGSKVAWYSSRDGNYEIYVADTTGTEQNVVRITNNAASDIYPVLSADGGKVAWSRERVGGWEYYVADTRGVGSVEQVTQVTNDGDNRHYNDSPSLSGDGTRLAWCSTRDGNSEVYAAATTGIGQSLVRITSDLADDTCPYLSGDGSKVAWNSNRSGDFEVYVADADGTEQGVVRVTDRSVGFTTWNVSPVLSTDGSKVAWFCSLNGSWLIYAADTAGTELNRAQITLARSSVMEKYPVISADGATVAWSSSRDLESWQVYVAQTSGTEVGLVQVTSRGNNGGPSMNGCRSK